MLALHYRPTASMWWSSPLPKMLFVEMVSREARQEVTPEVWTFFTVFLLCSL